MMLRPKYTYNTHGNMLRMLNISDNEKVFVRMEGEAIRYQYDNHLGSACLELDEYGYIISYEEYHPFGTTSYRAGRSATEVSWKRHKYCGKERDEETGLYYYGARYYAAWLGRFVSCDPLQHEQPGKTPFHYCSNNPINRVDPTGMQDDEKDKKKTDTKLKTTTDAGHGDITKGNKWLDPGTVDGDDYEKDYALTVEEQISVWLESFGIDNQRTRTGDIELPDEKRIEWRYKRANENESKVMVSIHLDSGSKAGLFSIYKSEEGKKLAESIADNMTALPLNEHAVREDERGLGILNGFTGDAAIIIELGGIDDSFTKNEIKENASLIGMQIAIGIYSYLNEGKKPNEKPAKKIEFIRDWFAN